MTWFGKKQWTMTTDAYLKKSSRFYRVTAMTQPTDDSQNWPILKIYSAWCYFIFFFIFALFCQNQIGLLVPSQNCHWLSNRLVVKHSICAPCHHSHRRRGRLAVNFFPGIISSQPELLIPVAMLQSHSNYQFMKLIVKPKTALIEC